MRGCRRLVGWRLLVQRLSTSVYQAWDPRARRWLCIKCYEDPERARREMNVLRVLSPDPGFARLEGVAVRRGRLCLVLEWVPGRPLRVVLRDRGPLPAGTAVAVAASLLRILHRLHRAGFVHGDLHSGNVLVVDGRRGRVKLIDFQHAARKGPDGRAV